MISNCVICGRFFNNKYGKITCSNRCKKQRYKTTHNKANRKYRLLDTVKDRAKYRYHNDTEYKKKICLNRRKYLNKLKQPFVNKKCIVCSNKFTARNRLQITCGKECSKKHEKEYDKKYSKTYLIEYRKRSYVKNRKHELDVRYRKRETESIAIIMAVLTQPKTNKE